MFNADEELTADEARQLLQGDCPDCGGQLYEGPMGGAAMNVHCDAKHTFWVAPGFPAKRMTHKPTPSATPRKE